MREELRKNSGNDQIDLGCIRQARPVYESVAQAAGFNIELGEKACFNHKTKTIHLSMKQLQEVSGGDPEIIDFIVLHEIGHFIEYSQDPDGYLGINERTRERPSPDDRLYFDLYNCLQDIYVNRNALNIAPQYRTAEGDFTDKIQTLYRDVAFQGRTFTDRPLCVQYAHYLLNLGMGVAEDITLSPEVKAEIDAGVTLYGKHYSYETFIETFLVPVVGYRRESGWTATMTQRSAVIEAAIIPVFEKLLAKDKQNETDLENQSGEMNPLGDMEPTLDDIQNAVESAIKEREEQNLSPKEKAKRLREAQAKKVAGRAGLSEGQGANFAESLERVQPLIHEIVNTFQELRTSHSSWTKKLEGPFTRGAKIDIPSVIKNFGDVVQNPSEAKIFHRDYQEETIEYVPKKIRLLLLTDLSRSMEENEQELQDVTLALAAAMATLCQEKEVHGTGLGGELGIIGFGSDAKELVEPSESVTLENIASIFPDIQANMGGTEDHYALQLAVERTQQIRAREQHEDTVNIVIEITDGETMNPQASKQYLKELERLGVLVGGIKIAPHSGDRGGEFEEIWNKNKVKPRGHYIHSAKELGSAVSKILEDAISESKGGIQ